MNSCDMWDWHSMVVLVGCSFQVWVHKIWVCIHPNYFQIRMFAQSRVYCWRPDWVIPTNCDYDIVVIGSRMGFSKRLVQLSKKWIKNVQVIHQMLNGLCSSYTFGKNLGTNITIIIDFLDVIDMFEWFEYSGLSDSPWTLFNTLQSLTLVDCCSHKGKCLHNGSVHWLKIDDCFLYKLAVRSHQNYKWSGFILIIRPSWTVSESHYEMLLSHSNIIYFEWR